MFAKDIPARLDWYSDLLFSFFYSLLVFVASNVADFEKHHELTYSWPTEANTAHCAQQAVITATFRYRNGQVNVTT